MGWCFFVTILISMNVQQANSKLIEHELSIVKDLSGSARVTLNDTGWDSRVYIVENGLYVFKFPRSEKVREQYAHEIAALDIAQHIGGIHVPKIIWRDAMNNYFGYEGVQGKPLSKILPSLHEEQKAKIGRQIGVFLRFFMNNGLTASKRSQLKTRFANFTSGINLQNQSFDSILVIKNLHSLRSSFMSHGQLACNRFHLLLHSVTAICIPIICFTTQYKGWAL